MKSPSLGHIIKHVQSLIEKGDWQTALEELQAANQKFAKTPAILTATGDCHIHLQQPELAIPYFRNVVDIEPDSVEARNNLGVAYMFALDYPNAEETYLEALQFKPDHVQTLKNLAFLYYQQEERLGDAATLLASVIRKEPSDCEALYLLGMCYQIGGQTDSATLCFERILTFQPDSDLAIEALKSLQSKTN
jgi:tetratricopeptide (TPR) repeat protein